jgi:hypothetical protein
MAGVVKPARLESKTSRAKLKKGRQPHWKGLVTGRAHLGYQRQQGASAGRWILRRYIDGKYRVIPLGAADDVIDADGDHTLSFEQAEAKARAMLDRPTAVTGRLTVRGAMERYIAFKRDQGQPIRDLVSRTNAHIISALGDKVVAELTAEQLRKWLATLAAMPAMKRSKPGGEQAYGPEPVGDEDVRRRRASANRVLAMLELEPCL